MSFKQIHNPDAPVFDQPPKQTGAGFFIRRLMSLAGKPVLAEKNLPIRPSNDKLAGKCYANSSLKLYRQQKSDKFDRRFRPNTSRTARQPASFSDKIESPGSVMSLQRPALTAHSATGFTNSSAPIPDIPVPRPPAALFENLSISQNAYDFSKDRANMKMLGVRAKLRSVKSGSVSERIKQSGRTEKFQPPVCYRPDKFAASEQTLIFSTDYLAAQNVFTNCLPSRCYFSPNPGDFGFLGILPTYISRSLNNAFSAKFAANFNRTQDSYDSRPEFARNLILECHTELVPIIGSYQAINPQAGKLKPSWPTRSRELPASFKNLQADSFRIDEAERRFRSQKKIVTERTSSFQSQIEAEGKAIKAEGLFAEPLQRLACCAIRNRLRLKLTLKRATYQESSPTYQLLLHRKNMAAKAALPEKLKTRFNSLKTKQRCANLHHSMLSANSDRQHFATRRFEMRFLAAGHVRYCRKSLKTCLTTNKQRLPSLAVKSLTFSVPATSHILRQFFAESRLLLESYDTIYLRPLPFLMRLSASDFTDIYLPEHRRRAFPARIDFIAEMRPQSLRRRNSLRSLRFRLVRIENGFSNMLMRAPRRISAAKLHFSTKDTGARAEIKESLSCRMASNRMNYLPGYRGRLEKFSYSSSSPAQITDSIALNMPIMGRQSPATITQRHFITPTEWQSSVKKYQCRVKLAPYPFGFPGFKLPAFPFAPIESAVSFTYLLLNQIRIDVRDRYFPVREKVFLPPLSLKNPRRFLFTDRSRINNELYREPDAPLQGILSSAKKIVWFDHDWGMRKYRVLSDNLCFNPLRARQRNRYADCFASGKIADDCSSIAPSQPKIELLMPGVRRLLLRCARFFEAERFDSDFTEIDMIRLETIARLPHQQAIRAREAFTECNSSLHFYSPRRYRPETAYPTMKNCCPGNLSYKQRLRTYNFPWRPETATPVLSVNYHLQEEPLLDRLTFFDQIGLENCFLTFNRLKISGQTTLTNQIAAEHWRVSSTFPFAQIETGRMTCYSRGAKGESRLDYEKPGLPQVIDRTQFYKLIDVFRLRLKRRKNNRNQLTDYLTGNIHKDACRFTEPAGMSIPARFDAGSLHWVILLRSFINLKMKDQAYDCLLTTADSTPPAFQSVRASIFTDFRQKKNWLEAGNLDEPPAIPEFGLPEYFNDHLRIIERAQKFSPCQSTVILSADSKLSSADCVYTEPGYELNMSMQQRPQYRRNLQLYILHMAMDLDDYDLYLGVAEKELQGDLSEPGEKLSDYRYPEIPEWIDLPDNMEKRVGMRI
ncbi:MAG: hypothetical protein GQF41_3113 [Candidatus Rifleibacterium amylolyticum]|nr:MAG: hypothetical protein GQF41_3113 [Candidatus Rifleibacterium amylolyticum]